MSHRHHSYLLYFISFAVSSNSYIFSPLFFLFPPSPSQTFVVTGSELLNPSHFQVCVSFLCISPIGNTDARGLINKREAILQYPSMVGKIFCEVETLVHGLNTGWITAGMACKCLVVSSLRHIFRSSVFMKNWSMKKQYGSSFDTWMSRRYPTMVRGLLFCFFCYVTYTFLCDLITEHAVATSNFLFDEVLRGCLQDGIVLNYLAVALNISRVFMRWLRLV